jgi:hypothetical protein
LVGIQNKSLTEAGALGEALWQDAQLFPIRATSSRVKSSKELVSRLGSEILEFCKKPYGKGFVKGIIGYKSRRKGV